LFFAIVLSIFGHFLLFYGLPIFHYGSRTEIANDLIIQTELRAVPPKKIHIATNPKNHRFVDKFNFLLTAPAGDSAQVEQGADTQGGQAFRLPESSILYYDAYIDGQLYQTGELHWFVEGNLYRLYITIPYPFVGPFIFESRGLIDAYGIAPTIYWTQRGTKSPRFSRFDRDEKGAGKMYFSEKPDFSPEIIPGTQDRFSLLFQLASLLNGDNKIDEEGAIRSLPVVDYSTLEMWQFKSYGETVSDDIPTLGRSVNRHYALMQRESDPYKRQVDIWLARDLEWLPGRMRSMEANGRVIELVFKQKAPISTSIH